MAKNIVITPIGGTSEVESPDCTYTARSYLITHVDLASIMNLMTNSTFLNDSKLLFGKPSEYVLSVRYYPIIFETLLNIAVPLDRKEQITFGGKQYAGVEGIPLTRGEYTYTYKLTYFHVVGRYQNFLDYMAKIRCYFPYVGYFELDPQIVMDKYVAFYMSLDYLNGVMTLYVVLYETMTDYTNETGGILIHTESKQLGIDIPFGSTNANDIAKNIYTNIIDIAMGGVKAIAGEGKMRLQGIAEVYGGAKDLFKQQEHFSKGSSPAGSMNNLHSPTSVFMEIVYPNAVNIDSTWTHINGLPLETTMSLSSMSGYTEVGAIEFNPNGYDIYNDEISEIITLLQQGVIL